MVTYQFRWDIILGSNLDFLMSGLQMTLFISATSLIFALIGGLILAPCLTSRDSRRAALGFGLTLGEIIRNTPILVQLLWVYYVLPIVFNIRVSSLAGDPDRLVALPWRPSSRKCTGRASRAVPKGPA